MKKRAFWHFTSHPVVQSVGCLALHKFVVDIWLLVARISKLVRTVIWPNMTRFWCAVASGRYKSIGLCSIQFDQWRHWWHVCVWLLLFISDYSSLLFFVFSVLTNRKRMDFETFDFTNNNKQLLHPCFFRCCCCSFVNPELFFNRELYFDSS